MVRNRRVWAALAAAIALITVAAGCGDDDDDGEAGGDDAGPIWVLLPDTATTDRWEQDDLTLFT
jgi:D-xylose transport system substrate-binding protein